MPKAASEVVLDVQDLLNRKGLDLITLTWPEFYKLSDRTRMKQGFMEELAEQLKEASVLIAYGNAIVLLARDYRFAPPGRK